MEKKILWMCIFNCAIRRALFFFFSLIFFNQTGPAQALELDPYPVDEFSKETTSIYLFREERSSFYWVNIGVPDVFFSNVMQTSDYPGPRVYSIRSIEYGMRACHWVTDQWQLRLTLPLETVALEDKQGVTHNTTRIGDVEIGSAFLFLGDKKKGSFLGADGWYRLPTGSDPFRQAYPLLSTGIGASRETIGIVAGQQVGGFSFFQSIHYETTQSLTLDSSNPVLGSGVFQWPENLLALGRIEWLIFQRAQRFVSLFYQLRMRMIGSMKLDGQEQLFGQGQKTDQLFFSSGGLTIRVDKEFSLGGQVSYFPYEYSSKSRPDYGLVFSLSLMFNPI
jgi:hypothetical protein